jgi:hypothetical protein
MLLSKFNFCPYHSSASGNLQEVKYKRHEFLKTKKIQSWFQKSLQFFWKDKYQCNYILLLLALYMFTFGMGDFVYNN